MKKFFLFHLYYQTKTSKKVSIRRLNQENHLSNLINLFHATGLFYADDDYPDRGGGCIQRH